MTETSDALVIGSGIAALTYALEASEKGREVTVITKRSAEEANTSHAQGGIAAVLSPQDSFEAHIEDTLRAGAGLCRRDVVELVVKDGPLVIERLTESGVRFDRSPLPPNGRGAHEGDIGVEYDLTREGGHSYR